MERVADINLYERNRYMLDEEIGLPPLNLKQKRLFKAVENVKKQNGRNSEQYGKH